MSFFRLSHSWILSLLLVLITPTPPSPFSSWFGPQVASAQAVHNITSSLLDSFDCSILNATQNVTQVAGDPVALETLRGWCASDLHCAQLYGQDGSAKLDTFIHLFQTSLTSQPVSSVLLEDPIFNLLCNMTTEEFLEKAWVLILINQLLSASPCDVNERPILRSDGSGVDCVCQPGKNCDSPEGPIIISIIVVVIIALSAVFQCGIVIWTRQRLLAANRINRIRKFQQQQQQQQQAAARRPTSVVSSSPYEASGGALLRRYPAVGLRDHHVS